MGQTKRSTKTYTRNYSALNVLYLIRNGDVTDLLHYLFFLNPLTCTVCYDHESGKDTGLDVKSHRRRQVVR